MYLLKALVCLAQVRLYLLNVISRHQKNLQSIPFGWKVSIIF